MTFTSEALENGTRIYPQYWYGKNKTDNLRIAPLPTDAPKNIVADRNKVLHYIELQAQKEHYTMEMAKWQDAMKTM
jgi:hypothetical protein